MKIPRDLNGRDLARALGRLCYEVTRQTGSHIRLTTSRGGTHHVTIPDHRPLRVGTLPPCSPRSARITGWIVNRSCAPSSATDPA